MDKGYKGTGSKVPGGFKHGKDNFEYGIARKGCKEKVGLGQSCEGREKFAT